MAVLQASVCETVGRLIQVAMDATERAKAMCSPHSHVATKGGRILPAAPW